MRPDFIYFKELLLGENSKFTLDFSGEEFVQRLIFYQKTNIILQV